jgi:rhomboid protease GluP
MTNLEIEPLSPQEFISRIHARTPRVWVTHTLIGLCAAVYLAMVATGVNFYSPEVADLVRWGGNAGVLTFGEGQYWRLMTCVFLHVGIIHIGMNLFVLWSIGRFMERLMGNFRFLTLYLLAGLAGSFASALINPRVVSAGASGAIFGLYGVLLGFLLHHRRTIPAQVLASLRKSGGTFVIYNLIFSFALKGIDISAHIGGLVAGFLLGLVAVPVP